MSRAEQFDLLPDDVAARWLKFGSWDRIFYPSFLGMTVQEVRADYCRMLMQYKPELDQPQGLVHGYMSAAKQEDLIAEGWVTKRGRSVVFCESEAIGATSGKVVARSVLTYNVSA
jgi:acyl-coenzyme A thioesterase PaaI-like protein